MIVLPFKVPEELKLDKSSYSRSFGKFELSPLRRGFGVTIGHAMKRVLLSSIQGAAIYSVKIEGVQHEFMTIEGVVEDVALIILNLKQVKLKLTEGKSAKVTLNFKGKGQFTAKDIEDASNGEVVVYNPEAVIANLNEDAEFSMELNIKLGRGYVSAEENRSDEDPIGTIPIDCIFSPVTKVNYIIENTRVGDRTDYEKLVMEITTDSSVTPEEAVTFAGQILTDHIGLFIKFEVVEDKEHSEEEDPELQYKKNLLKMPIEDLELSVRSYNCLNDAKVKTIGDLVKKKESEMLRFRNFGKKSLAELTKVLRERGLDFGMDIEKFLNDTNGNNKKK
ncbi:MAG: DNA-directed RNA polymerase subunit alpha [Candidatus Delongbacteria bacterium]|nr:DNA-directed RNA polymerase subunit alpha [Candidatus Delongbacteria bacterium]MBN2836410.1 DNA-directed RNA polymerase subunit alpha [Candidatus Delongbacteria bacterium]